MGEKRRVKSKGKMAKATKHGLRPHELRQQDGVKALPGHTALAPVAAPRIPRG